MKMLKTAGLALAIAALTATSGYAGDRLSIEIKVKSYAKAEQGYEGLWWSTGDESKAKGKAWADIWARGDTAFKTGAFYFSHAATEDSTATDSCTTDCGGGVQELSGGGGGGGWSGGDTTTSEASTAGGFIAAGCTGSGCGSSNYD
jgi:hypothetical protein